MEAHRLRVVNLSEDERSLGATLESVHIGKGESFAKVGLSFAKKIDGKPSPEYPTTALHIGDEFLLSRVSEQPNVVVALYPHALHTEPRRFEQVVERLRQVALSCQRGDEPSGSLYRNIVARLFGAAEEKERT